MKLIRTEIDGVFILEPNVFEDARGYFFESFNSREFKRLTGLSVDFVQDNESRSSYGVVRGLHFQRPPHAQNKLVRVVSGRVMDYAVDIRRGSPTYGKWVSAELSAENHRQFFVPSGFAHGFAVLSDTAIVQYKCDDFYAPECEGALLWKDPDIAIRWPLPESDMLFSDKDRKHGLFKDFDTPFCL